MSSKKVAFYAYIFFHSLFCVSSVYLNQYYLEDACHGKSEFTLHLKNITYTSGILISQPSQGEGECTYRLQPEFGSSVILSINSLTLRPEYRLFITDFDNFKVELLGVSKFSDERKSFYSDGPMTIHYKWNSSQETDSRVIFKLTFTQVHEAPCNYDEYQCRNKLCIPGDLACGRHNHCGDNSDQDCIGITEFPTEEIVLEKRVISNIYVIIIIVVIVIVGIVFIVAIALVIRRPIRKKKQLASNNSPLTVPAPVPQTPSAPPVTDVQPSAFARFRQSLRGNKSSVTPRPEEPKNENYQVPSVYPQITSASDYAGVDNPEFKGDGN